MRTWSFEDDAMSLLDKPVGADLDPQVVGFISRPNQMYLDGQRVDALSGRRFDTVDPPRNMSLPPCPTAVSKTLSAR
jgi:hypothetical protein